MTSLISLFSHIFHSFLRSIIHQLNKYFSKSFFAFFRRSVLMLIYSFNQAFWLNWITLWTFLKTNPWFNVCLKFVMCITCSVLSCKLATNFKLIHFFDFHSFWYEFYVIFQGIEHQLHENILHHFLHYSFYEIFIKLRSIFYPLKIIYWKLL